VGSEFHLRTVTVWSLRAPTARSMPGAIAPRNSPFADIASTTVAVPQATTMHGRPGKFSCAASALATGPCRLPSGCRQAMGHPSDARLEQHVRPVRSTAAASRASHAAATGPSTALPPPSPARRRARAGRAMSAPVVGGSSAGCGSPVALRAALSPTPANTPRWMFVLPMSTVRSIRRRW
jgi:hypothetical protein